MKSVLFLRGVTGNNFGGIEEKVIYIAKELYREKILNPILATSDHDSLFAKRFRELDFPVYIVPMQEKKEIIKAAEVIEGIIKNNNISLLHTHRFKASLIARMVKRKNNKTKHIFRIHTHFEGSDSFLRQLIGYKIDGLTSNYVDCFAPISKTIANELEAKSSIDKEKIRVVYNGIPILGEPDPSNVSNCLLTPSMGIVGDLQERKQQLMAVEIVALLKREGFKIKLHLIGAERNNYLTQIKNVAKVEGIEDLIHIHGYVDKQELYRIIKNIPVVLLPSKFEGMPTSIIEAMSLRKIVVATDVGATSELINHGENGFLFSPNDKEGLIAILRKLFTTPSKDLEQIRDLAYKTWQGNFTLKHMMDGLIKIYHELNVI